MCLVKKRGKAKIESFACLSSFLTNKELATITRMNPHAHECIHTHAYTQGQHRIGSIAVAVLEQHYRVLSILLLRNTSVSAMHVLFMYIGKVKTRKHTNTGGKEPQ